MFQGFFTLPPHHTSSYAISPVASLAMSTAPAARNLHQPLPFAIKCNEGNPIFCGNSSPEMGLMVEGKGVGGVGVYRGGGIPQE